jgi:hypothetical protein
LKGIENAVYILTLKYTQGNLTKTRARLPKPSPLWSSGRSIVAIGEHLELRQPHLRSFFSSHSPSGALAQARCDLVQPHDLVHVSA